MALAKDPTTPDVPPRPVHRLSRRAGAAASRAFDVFGAALGLLLLSPALLAVALVIKLTSRGPVLFTQERVGRYFRPFRIYKFRTMVPDAPHRGGVLTVGEDPRITRVGRWLRKTKIDELPQLLNVLKGEMSLVGPRPEVPRYVAMFRRDYEEILQVRPGLTDAASLRYRDEARLLAGAANPEEAYIRDILPDKIRLAKEYLGRASFFSDLVLVWETVVSVVGLKPEPQQAGGHGR